MLVGGVIAGARCSPVISSRARGRQHCNCRVDRQATQAGRRAGDCVRRHLRDLAGGGHWGLRTQWQANGFSGRGLCKRAVRTRRRLSRGCLQTAVTVSALDARPVGREFITIPHLGSAHRVQRATHKVSRVLTVRPPPADDALPRPPLSPRPPPPPPPAAQRSPFSARPCCKYRDPAHGEA